VGRVQHPPDEIDGEAVVEEVLVARCIPFRIESLRIGEKRRRMAKLLRRRA
jgi:hypothetical protein